METFKQNKKLFFLIVFLLFAALCYNVFGQDAGYFFEVQKLGSGKQNIIFIPGFSCSGQVWNETTASFEKDYTCHVLTMPGFAGAAPETNPTFKGWEEQVVNYIRKNNLEKPVVIGHSMGGGLALAIAADYPGLVKKIVVVDALPCLSAMMNPGFKSKENLDCSDMVNQITAMSDDAFYQMQKKSIPTLLSDTSKQALVIGWSLKSDRKTFAQMYCDFSNTDLRQSIASIQCPALILLEGNFKNLDGPIQQQYRNLKTAKLQYANTGLHFVMYDDKDWYLAQLHKFMAAK